MGRRKESVAINLIDEALGPCMSVSDTVSGDG